MTIFKQLNMDLQILNSICGVPTMYLFTSLMFVSAPWLEIPGFDKSNRYKNKKVEREKQQQIQNGRIVELNSVFYLPKLFLTSFLHQALNITIKPRKVDFK
jgi:hypothetical protein